MKDMDVKEILETGKIPLIGLIILEIFWNIIDSIFYSSITSNILYLVKFCIYGYAGYLSGKIHEAEPVQGAITGGVIGFVFAFIEGFIISLIFSGSLFYHWGPGIPIIPGITTIIKQVVYGVIFGAIGSLISDKY